MRPSGCQQSPKRDTEQFGEHMKKSSSVLGVLGICLSLSFAVQAQEIPQIDTSNAPEPDEEGGGDERQADPRLYISPMFSYTVADQDRDTDDGMGGALSLGKALTPGLNLELTGFYQTFDPVKDNNTANKNDEEAMELTGYGLAAMIFPSQTLSNLYVLLAVHQGSASNHPTPTAGTPKTRGTPMDYKTTIFDPGLGYLIPLSGVLGFEMAIRAELRYRMDAHTRSEPTTGAGVGGQKHFYEPVANIGVMIPLGKAAVEAAPAEVEVVEAAGDADGDGVTDDKDQCPDTPAGASVNEQGCEGDTDGDGVVDRLDECPDTPAGTAVNEKGCPAVTDTDGDGVPDDKDQCPDTPAGTSVDENGCPPKAETGCRAPAPGEPISLEGCATGEGIVLKGVNFESGNARLTANAKVILNQVADSLAAQSALKVEIGGHTDAQGSDAFNQKLSEKRAQSVKDYLVARGIDASRLTAKGYGESEPVDSNETPEGREQNRRVEMKVLENAPAQ
jgi:OmpA-OmpF porin, OOP family